MKYALEEQDHVIEGAKDAVLDIDGRAANNSTAKALHLTLLTIKSLLGYFEMHSQIGAAGSQIEQIHRQVGTFKQEWVGCTKSPVLDPEFWVMVTARIRQRKANRDNLEEVKAIIEEVEQQKLAASSDWLQRQYREREDQ
jgi:hypothetical protein